ncbi:uncharacterized protein YggE [Sphingomonas kyeonggiensis]|uniref:Uncharacterized protein YggE n=1 Tax=Sphingomonas kyeonggiensis TaxID=1268553 RepID=A0A7W7K0A1_9SPHN|nr:SIMPL domain-containing protein [Sphingomonas kyeonggiensis]MBB4838687.1 uncharacterized protein YggE [Sphingomonas kyeonggiensis]
MRSVMLGAGILLGLTIGQDAAAQDRDAETIQVLATGSVETPPEVATISYSLRGEGKLPDDASRALVAGKAAVEKALASVAGTKLRITTGTLTIREVRGKDCGDNRYDATARLSTGACAIEGYIAEMTVAARVSPVDKAGTLTGLAARAGGSDVGLQGFEILDARAARKRAMAAAVANGTAEAEAIAAASHVKLGRLIRAVDGDASVVRVDAIVSESIGGLPNAPAPEPVPIAITPKSVETSARLVLTFEVVR